MILNCLEKRSEEVKYTEAEKQFMALFGIEYEDAPASAVREITYLTCLKLLSESVAKTPLYVVQKTSEGQERLEYHPVNELLSLRPNEYMTAVDFWRAYIVNAYHNGYGAAYKVYSEDGRLLELIPVEITSVTIDNAGLLRSNLQNKVIYGFTVPGSGIEEYAFQEELMLNRGMTFNGIEAMPYRSLGKTAIDTNIKMQKYLNNLYDNGLTNKAVVQLTSDIKEEKELRKLQNKFERIFKAGKRIFTVPAGYNVSTLNLSLADAQFDTIRRMSISQIAALLGIKMHQLNDLQDTNNNSLEQQQLSYLQDTLLVIFTAIEQEATWSLFTREERNKGIRARFNTNVILRSTPIQQKEILCGYVTSGILTPNDARLELQRMKLEGGDDLIVNAGVMKLKDITKAVKKEGGE